MRVFVAGATGAIGRYLVPALVTAGHQVTGTTRSPGKAGQLTRAGATAAVVDGLDQQAVLTAVKAAEPEVIIHQMTDLTRLRNFLASCLGAKPPLHAPAWLGRLAAGQVAVLLMTQTRGAANAKARRELGWVPGYPSWRDGFAAWVKGGSS
jgi:NAD(P)-dependent dehydrogenase (short-subunit alcohol dehydrogenase family)